MNLTPYKILFSVLIAAFFLCLSPQCHAQLGIPFSIDGKMIRVITTYDEVDICNQEIQDFKYHYFEWPCLNLLEKLSCTLKSNNISPETFVSKIPTTTYKGTLSPWSVVRQWSGSEKDKYRLLEQLRKR